MSTFTNNQTKAILAIAIASQALLPLAAMAGPVRIAGQTVINVTTGSGGATAAQRTATIQKNIDNALVATQNPSPSSVGVVTVKGQPVITLGGFLVTTVDAAAAKANKTTPSLLAQKWAGSLKATLKNKASVDSYVAQLSGSTAAPNAGTTTTSAGSYPYYKQGHLVYIPAGMQLPVELTSSVSSQTARPGDRVEGKIAENVNLGDTSIPAGSTITGKVTEADAAQKLGKSGLLGMKFDTLHTPDGQDVPISAHIVGGIGKYEELANGTDIVKGEATKDKVKQALVRGAVGAGGGALLGTTIGAIAGHHGAGKGAIAGTAIGAALGVADSLILRKGHEVNVQSGQTLQLQLDAPASLSAVSNAM